MKKNLIHLVFLFDEGEKQKYKALLTPYVPVTF